MLLLSQVTSLIPVSVKVTISFGELFSIATNSVMIFVVLAMSAQFSRRDPAAAWLCAPYLLWLLFAAYLNLGVWLLNR